MLLAATNAAYSGANRNHRALNFRIALAFGAKSLGGVFASELIASALVAGKPVAGGPEFFYQIRHRCKRIFDLRRRVFLFVRYAVEIVRNHGLSIGAEHDKMFRIVTFDNREPPSSVQRQAFYNGQPAFADKTAGRCGEARLFGGVGGNADHADHGGETEQDAGEIRENHEPMSFRRYRTKITAPMLNGVLSAAVLPRDFVKRGEVVERDDVAADRAAKPGEVAPRYIENIGNGGGVFRIGVGARA